jgi:hypothetical protein
VVVRQGKNRSSCLEYILDAKLVEEIRTYCTQRPLVLPCCRVRRARLRSIPTVPTHTD